MYLLENDFLKYKNVSGSQKRLPKLENYIFVAIWISWESNTYFDCFNLYQGFMAGEVQHCQQTGEEPEFLNMNSPLGLVGNWRETRRDGIEFCSKKHTL